MHELPVLNPLRCTGCGDCVAICPVDCLAMTATRPWLPRPRNCIACTACVVICPVEALELKPLMRC